MTLFQVCAILSALAKETNKHIKQEDFPMKKIIAVIMALTLAVMLPTLALAETVEINWTDVEPEVTAAGLEGDFYALNAVALKLWIPSVLVYQEDSVGAESDESGTIAMWTTEDDQYGVVVQYLEGTEGLDMDALVAGIEEEGAKDIERCILNGLDAVSYTLEDADANFVAFVTESGNVLQFIFAPASDEDFAAVAMLISASIQPE